MQFYQGAAMTIQEVEAFLTVVQYGSFSAAAEKLYVTQPALGRRIKALEDELGYKLFSRGKGIKKAELTRQGKAFIGLAQRWESLWQEMQAETMIGAVKSFYVASVGSLIGFSLPDVFKDFMDANPECSLHVSTLHSVDAYDHVLDKQEDIAFISDPRYSSQIRTAMLFQENLCLVSGRNLDLPQKIKVSELDPRKEIHTLWDRNFEEWHRYYIGEAVPPRIYLDEMGFIQNFMQMGGTWAIMPMSIANRLERITTVQIHDLDVELPKRTIYYIYRIQDPSPYQDNLLELCREKLKGESGITVYQAESAAEAAVESDWSD